MNNRRYGGLQAIYNTILNTNLQAIVLLVPEVERGARLSLGLIFVLEIARDFADWVQYYAAMKPCGNYIAVLERVQTDKTGTVLQVPVGIRYL